MLQDIGQIAITVSDLDRAKSYYQDQLGLTFLFPAPNMLFFQCGAIRLMLSTEASHGTHSSVLYFRTGDIQQEAAALRGRGVVFERDPLLIAKMPDHELWMAFFRDPDQNLLALMSEVR